MKHAEKIFPSILVAGAIVVAASFAYVATDRTLTGLESVLLQFMSLGIGLIGSFVLGRQSAREAAREIIKPHARSAFRRLVSLYQSLSRVAGQIAESQGSEDVQHQRVVLAKLEAIVVEQLSTADDALEDWRDIVPEDVEEIRQKLLEERG